MGLEFTIEVDLNMANAHASGVMKALVVDDDRVSRAMHKRMLTDLGFEVHEAEDGEAAVNFFTNGNEAVLVLMDRHMPKMSGVEATKLLREMGIDAKIAAITADERSGGDFWEAGVDAFLTKPVWRAELTDLLRTFNLIN